MEKTDQAKDRDQLGFDGRMARLEQIVASLEEGGVELETSIAGYKEGVALLKSCREILAGYKKQVEELAGEVDDGVRPFAKDPDIPAPRVPDGEGP